MPSRPVSLELWKKQDENLVVLTLKKDTEKSHDLKRIQKSHMPLRSMILGRTCLCAVSYCAELSKTRISRRKQNQKEKNILTHWSVAQVGSNDEKN